MQFDELYQTYKDVVYNLCLHYLQNQEDSQDAAQEIFVKIHHNLATFKAQAQPKTWIYRISVNHCLDILKSRKRAKRFAFITDLFFPNSSEVKHDTAHFDHPGVQLEQKEATEQLFKYINELPEQQKTAIILTKIEELSLKEAAAIMDKTPKSVESLVQRAKQNLKEKLEQAREEG